MWKLYVFDLDGTLLDTLDDLTKAVNYTLGEYGLPLRTREEVRSFIGNGAKNLMARAVGYDHAHAEDILQSFRTYYNVHSADDTRPYQGVVELVRALREKGAKTAVLSNKPDGATKALAEVYFKGLFDCVLGENECGGIRKKPAPDALFAIMQSYGVSQAEPVYIGDSEVDVLTACNAGVDCLSVAWGFKDESFLREALRTKAF